MALRIKLKDVPAKWRKRAEVDGWIDPALAERVAGDLRHEARLAWLDDRVAQSKKFNRYADLLVREAGRCNRA